MSTLFAPPDILVTEDEMEKITGLTAYELRKHQPDGFGMPGHWRTNRQGILVYTDRGLAQLANGLEAHGFNVAAVCLRVKLRELMETPSRVMIPPTGKNEPWFRAGGMA